MLCKMCSPRDTAALPSSEAHVPAVFILSKIACAHQHWLLTGLTNVKTAFGMHMIPRRGKGGSDVRVTTFIRAMGSVSEVFCTSGNSSLCPSAFVLRDRVERTIVMTAQF